MNWSLSKYPVNKKPRMQYDGTQPSWKLPLYLHRCDYFRSRISLLLFYQSMVVFLPWTNMILLISNIGLFSRIFFFKSSTSIIAIPGSNLGADYFGIIGAHSTFVHWLASGKHLYPSKYNNFGFHLQGKLQSVTDSSFY